jgi:uncharacterized protein GlcG (DUF336 family)
MKLKNRKPRFSRVLCLLSCLLPGSLLQAEYVVPARLMGLDLARDIAQGAIDACRKDGYQISVVVVDRSGRMQVMMRDLFSNEQFTSLAEGKAQAVIMSGSSSAALRENRPDMVNELNLLPGVVVLRGGLPIQVAGSTVGAVGVSGAPGGDKDEACAQHGLDVVQERLDFAE